MQSTIDLRVYCAQRAEKTNEKTCSHGQNRPGRQRWSRRDAQTWGALVIIHLIDANDALLKIVPDSLAQGARWISDFNENIVGAVPDVIFAPTSGWYGACRKSGCTCIRQSDGLCHRTPNDGGVATHPSHKTL